MYNFLLYSSQLPDSLFRSFSLSSTFSISLFFTGALSFSWKQIPSESYSHCNIVMIMIRVPDDENDEK